MDTFGLLAKLLPAWRYLLTVECRKDDDREARFFVLVFLVGGLEERALNRDHKYKFT